MRQQQEIGARLGKWENLATAGLLLVVCVAAACRIPSSSEALLNKIAKNFPVRASDYIRENHLPTPLFNEYQWGGFLTWYLPEYPVAIDGRRDLYGEEINLRYFQVTNAEVPLNTDPAFAGAQTFLLPASSPMAEALATIPDFKVVYRDDLGHGVGAAELTLLGAQAIRNEQTVEPPHPSDQTCADTNKSVPVPLVDQVGRSTEIRSFVKNMAIREVRQTIANLIQRPVYNLEISFRSSAEENDILRSDGLKFIQIRFKSIERLPVVDVGGWDVHEDVVVKVGLHR